MNRKMLRPKFPPKLQFLFRPARYKVAHGGRGGAKSWGVARALIIKAFNNKLLILCAREYQNSITESVHRLLSEQIEAMGFGPWFTINNNSIVCKVTGSEFIFAGLHNNVSKIKSTEGVDICWVEEAEKVTEHSWKTLIPTIRKKGSEIWVTFNPDEETDPTYQRFIIHPPPDAVVVEINWMDNPWFPTTELVKEKDYDYSVDPESADHIWGGKLNVRSNAQIFRGKYVIEAFEPHKLWNGPYFGQDFGFSTDPSATIKSYIYERDLYIEKEFFGYGLMNDELNAGIRAAMPEIQGHIVRADCARPETIAEMNKRGLMMQSCKKWTGCVEDGIQYLRSFERIVIHPRNTHMKEEARLYKYKVDRLSGDILPIIVDAHNHGWDGTRYGLEPMILNFHEEVIVIDGAPDAPAISPELDELDEAAF